MPENNNNNQPLDFAEKVLQTLKRTSRAVDLNEPIAPSRTVDPVVSAQSNDVQAFVQYPEGGPGGNGPGTGGNKDIVIIPGYTGTAATSTSQVNFYWSAPAIPDSTGIDTNVRATIYNFALSTTKPVLVFGGYDGTNQYKPTPLYGTGTGITAKIWIDPFLGRIDADQFGFNTLAATGVSTATGILTWDTTQNRIRVGVAGTAKTIAYTEDISPFSGAATTASNLNLATSAAATNHFITMSASQTATGVAGAAISTVSTVFVVPSTGVVNASGFSGNVTGNVSGNQTGNMTGTVSGNVTGNVSGNVTGGLSGNVTGNVTGTVSGNVTGNVSGNLTGNVSGNVTGGVSGNVTGNVTGTVSGNVTGNVSGNLTGGVSGNVTGNVTGTVSGNVTGNVSGNLTGNVSGNVTGGVSGNLTGNVTGIASTANSVAQLLTAQSGDHFITFSPSGVTLVGAGVSVATALKFIPSTGVVTASGFSGNVTGGVSGNVTGNMTGTVSGNVTGNVSGNLTGNVSGNVTGGVSGNVTGNVTGTVSGNVTGNVSGNLTGNVSGNVTGNISGNLTGNVTGIASTANSVAQLLTAQSGDHFITFSPSGVTLVGAGVSVATALKFIPSTGVVTASGFSGNVTGTVSGNVTGSVSGSVTGNVSGNLTGNVSGNVTGGVSGNVTGNVTGTVSGNVTGNVSGNLTGNVSGNVTGNVSGNLTGNVVGTATTAQNVNVVAADAATGNHFLPFVRTQTGSGLALSTDSTLYYDPTGNILYSTNFNGSFTGTISGIATTAANMVVNDAAENTNHFVLFSSRQTGAGVAVSSDSTFTINPSTNAMSMGSGSVTANSVTVGSAARTVSTSTGNLILDSTGGQVDINDNVVISGNLTIQGTTVTVDSTVSTIVDPVIVVGSGVGGSHSTFDNNMDRGIEFRWSNAGTATTGFFGYSDTDGRFKFIPNATTVAGSNVYTGTVGTVQANLSGSVTGNVSGNVTGNVSGSVTGGVSGNVTGNVSGSVTGGLSGNVTGNVTGTVSGNVTGNVSGNLTGGVSGNVTGNVTGTVSGNVTGNVSGNLTGNVSGNVTGGVSGNVTGNITGTVSGNVTGNVSGNLTGNVSGNLTGSVSGNVTGIASTANSVAQLLTAQSGDHFITFSPSGVTLVGAGVSVATALKFIPSTGVVSASGFSGNVTGTVSGNVTGNVTGTVSGNVTGNVSGNLTGNVSGNVTGGVSGNVTGNVTGTVSGNVTGNVSGNLTGNVSGNVTGGVSGNLTGNVTGIASTANSVAQLLTAQSGDHFITFSPSGVTLVGAGVSVATALKFVPSTGVVSASGFSGNVTGTVSGNVTGNVSGSVTGNVSGNLTGNVSGNVTGGVSGNVTGNVTGTVSGNVTGNVSGNVTGGVSGNVTGNVTGIASTANSVAQLLTAQSGDHFITFSPSGVTLVGAGVSVATALKFIPSTGVVSASGFSGNVTGNVSGNQTGNMTGTVSGNVTGNVSGNLTGNVSGNVTGGVSGNVTGNVTGTVSGNVTGNVSGNLTGNVSGNVTGNVSGNLTGSVSGTATTAQNLNVASTAAATNYVLLSSSATGTGIAVSTKTSLIYNASTDTLTVPTIVGSGSGLTLTSTTAITNSSYLTIQTNSGDDNSTSDFFIRGINSTAVSKFSVDGNGNLRATTKSFDIPHPTKEGKRLVYGVLEGPEHGVYHRGTVEGKGNILIELPEYWTQLVNDSYSIQLTPWGNYGVQILDKAPNSFIISATGNPFTKKFKLIKVDYIVHGSRKDAHLDIEQD